MDEPTYTVPEVSEMLGVSRQAIWRAVRRGSLECFTLGGPTLRPRVVMMVTASAVERYRLLRERKAEMRRL